ncbi:DUF378 domain-containing protein [Salirhabdus sp. Marseille-P4669]|uniref:DUF378 domain-containing protein n=1 Tax=Salirhabdus sp. Marseille-P4669 TaxID=2042310 RepID=UPI000C7B05BD|nr:DUF378 domain-containing protein [Salirhabdus sp. Marseille-P4669]
MGGFHRFALLIVIIGAINWGLIGFFLYDLVAGVFGGGEQDELIPRIIYSIVGLCGLALLPLLFKSNRED